MRHGPFSSGRMAGETNTRVEDADAGRYRRVNPLVSYSDQQRRDTACRVWVTRAVDMWSNRGWLPAVCHARCYPHSHASLALTRDVRLIQPLPATESTRQWNKIETGRILEGKTQLPGALPGVLHASGTVPPAPHLEARNTHYHINLLSITTTNTDNQLV